MVLLLNRPGNLPCPSPTGIASSQGRPLAPLTVIMYRLNLVMWPVARGRKSLHEAVDFIKMTSIICIAPCKPQCSDIPTPSSQ